jgi:predicted lysophospholipase L1 biosynthesis ABC-type transport system permease subunit
MKWFRSNIRSGVRLALFALFVQFALSFGHFHALAAPSPSATQSTLTHTKAIGSGDLVVQGQRARPKQAPAKHDNDQNDPDGCAICAVMAMAGTVLSASPPILLLPDAVEFLYRTTDAEFLHLKSAGVAFQPRAPPAS